MSKSLQKTVNWFCSEQPNLEKIHQSNDINRLDDVIIASIIEDAPFPYDNIQQKLETKTFMTPNSGNIDDFMESVRTYVEPKLPGLKWAKEKDLLSL